MPLIQWTDDFNVHVKMIDEQHKKIIEMINYLHDEIRYGKGENAVANVLDDMLAYIEIHFTQEEQLMSENHYAELNSHHKKHQVFIRTTLGFYKEYRLGHTYIAEDISNYLKDWFVNHILHTDKRLGKALNKLGVY
jgi:hemerythrin